MSVTPTPLQQIDDPLLSSYGVELFIKRDDLSHPDIGGNKWRKLKYNLLLARRQRYETILSFGGAYSNHLYALAAAGRVCGFSTVGVVRGEAPAVLSSTLAFARAAGMQLHFVDRETYRLRDEPAFIAELHRRFGRVLILPEGGSNELALPGCSEIIAELDLQTEARYDYVVCPTGTGGTLAGLIQGLRGTKNALGIAVLRNAAQLESRIRELLQHAGAPDLRNWSVIAGYEHGGYAKVTPELLAFVADFERRTKAPLEYIYSGKMMFALYDMIRTGQIPRGARVVALHTGGLQGKASMDEKYAHLHAEASRIVVS